MIKNILDKIKEVEGILFELENKSYLSEMDVLECYRLKDELFVLNHYLLEAEEELQAI